MLPPPPPPPRFAADLIAAVVSATASVSPPNLIFFAAAVSVLCFLKPSAPPSSVAQPRHRRFLHSTASMRPTGVVSPPRAPPPSLAFSSAESLSEWLRPRLPSGALASWGVAPGTKSLRNLWLELSHGETSLLEPQSESSDQKGASFTPLRAVHVTTVRIRNPRNGAILVESHQLLSDGSVRRRFRPLSEKMKPGEAVEEAAVRAVWEELGKDSVRIVPGSYQTRVEERDSASYPGLQARYVLHSVDAEVDGLPEEEEFSTEENGEGVEEMEEAVFVKRHFWKWVKEDENGDDNTQQP